MLADRLVEWSRVAKSGQGVVKCGQMWPNVVKRSVNGQHDVNGDKSCILSVFVWMYGVCRVQGM